MKGWTRSLPAVAIALFAARSVPPGRLDLDIYAPAPLAARPAAAGSWAPALQWTPGDPRDERGEPVWVRHLSHVGYAGLGLAGLAGSVASGGVAPAVGFGLVTAVQSYLEWRQVSNSR